MTKPGWGRANFHTNCWNSHTPTWLVLRTQVVEIMQQTTKSAHYYSNAIGRHVELTRSKSHCANNLCEMRYVQLPIYSSQSFQEKYPKAHGVSICNLF